MRRHVILSSGFRAILVFSRGLALLILVNEIHHLRLFLFISAIVYCTASHTVYHHSLNDGT